MVGYLMIEKNRIIQGDNIRLYDWVDDVLVFCFIVIETGDEENRVYHARDVDHS